MKGGRNSRHLEDRNAVETTSLKCAGCGHTFEVPLVEDRTLSISGSIGMNNPLPFVSIRERHDRRGGPAAFTCPSCGLTN